MTWPPEENFHNFIKSLNQEADISYDVNTLDEIQSDSESRIGGHCLLWARTDAVMWEIPLIAKINMHLRFDGYLGFPGGLVELDETVIEGVEREVKEEMNIKSLQLKRDHFVCQMKIPDKSKKKKFLRLFFFEKEVSEEEFMSLEAEATKAEHFGTEILGNIRVPLHRYRESDGFARFLANQFAGTAKQQLLLVLYKEKIFSKDEIMNNYYLHHNKSP